jgi:hypothetical protein
MDFETRKISRNCLFLPPFPLYQGVRWPPPAWLANPFRGTAIGIDKIEEFSNSSGPHREFHKNKEHFPLFRPLEQGKRERFFLVISTFSERSRMR